MNNVLKIMACMFIASAINMSAKETASMTFTYVGNEQNYNWFGTNKAEKYDVAIALQGEDFVGKSVTEVKVPVPYQIYRDSQTGDGNQKGVPCFKDLSVWITDDLENVGTGEGSQFSADINWPEEVDCEHPDFAWVSVALENPCTITQKGLYVGYSLTVDLMQNESTGYTYNPIMVEKGNREGSFFIKAGRTYRKWQDRSLSLNWMSPIQVTLEGEFPANALEVVSIDNYRTSFGESGIATVNVVNKGLSEISSIKYRSEIDGMELTENLSLPRAIPALFDFPTTIQVKIPAPENGGAMTVIVEVLEVNNAENLAQQKQGEGFASVPLFKVKNTPLVEEFTGTGCGFCPRGFVAMERMSELYPEDFIGVAWHSYNNSDAMYPATGYPNLTSAAPECSYNRGELIDPYGPLGPANEFTMDKYFELYTQTPTPVQVSVEAVWTDEERTQITATAVAQWAELPENMDSEYRFEFILVGNDLYGEGASWLQSNYYANQEYGELPYMEEFCNATIPYVMGLHYNDVGLMSSALGGIENSIETIELGQPNSYTYTFTPEEAVNAYGETIAFHKDKLRVVAVVLEASSRYGHVLNAGRADVKDLTAINTVVSNAEILSTTYFDLMGRQVANPKNGLFIKVDRMNDGNITSTKVSL